MLRETWLRVRGFRDSGASERFVRSDKGSVEKDGDGDESVDSFSLAAEIQTLT